MLRFSGMYRLGLRGRNAVPCDNPHIPIPQGCVSKHKIMKGPTVLSGSLMESLQDSLAASAGRGGSCSEGFGFEGLGDNGKSNGNYYSILGFIWG